LRGKDVMAGVIDVATHEVETAEQVAARIREVMRHVEPARLLPCTNCGMVPLPRAVARAKLQALGAGARLVRRELGHA
ncbi:MAG TPA: methionine synthase, partial [Methylomirabilota bacterium]